MRMKEAHFIYNTFVISKWSYASFLQPFLPAAAKRLDGLDAGFLSATIIACRTRGTGARRSNLHALRALARLPSPQHRREAGANRYVVRLHRIVKDDVAPTQTKDRATAALAALSQLPTFRDLVPDIDRPWTTAEARADQVDEWFRATYSTSRPVPPPGPGAMFYPPALRLKDTWAVALAAKYHCSTFPILQRALTREGPRTRSGNRLRPLYEKAQRTHAEDAALAVLPLLHSSTCSVSELSAITEALRTLRPREKWSRSQSPVA